MGMLLSRKSNIENGETGFSLPQIASVFSIYFLLFGVFYLSYPLNDSLPTDGDAWFYLATFNSYVNRIEALIGGKTFTQFLYPDTFPEFGGEPCLGLSPIWIFAEFLTGSDLWSYFIVFVFIHASNAVAFYFLIRVYRPDITYFTSFCSGIIFVCNVYVIGNNDNVNTIFIAPGLFSLAFLIVFIRKQQALQYFVLFCVFLFLQLSASVYNFVFICIFSLSFAVFNFRRIYSSISSQLTLYSLSVLSLLTASGIYIFMIIILPDKFVNYETFFDALTVKLFSMTFDDWVRVLPFSLYDAFQGSVSVKDQYQSFFPGFVFLILVIVGFWYHRQGRLQLLTAIILAILVGVGTFVVLFGKKFTLPLGCLFEQVGTYRFLRLPYRSFIIIHICFALFAGIALQMILSKAKRFKTYVGIFIVCLVMLENIPLKRTYNSVSAYQKLYVQYLADIPSDINNILFLPVGDISTGDGIVLERNKLNYIHMYWQTLMKKDVLNGFTAFNPPHVMELNRAIYSSKQTYADLLTFCKKYGVQQVVLTRSQYLYDDNSIEESSLREAFKESGINITVLVDERV